MSFMSIDLVDLDTGEAFVGLADRAEAPDFGVPFEYQHEGRARRVKRVPSIIQAPLIKNYQTRAIQKQRFHPAFEKHDARGFGVVEGKRDVDAAIDWSKKNARSDDEVWTWGDLD